MIQMNLRTAKSNKETNLNYKQIWPGLVEAVCNHPQTCRRVFFELKFLEH